LKTELYVRTGDCAFHHCCFHTLLVLFRCRTICSTLC
jgi:hypothetical protein